MAKRQAALAQRLRTYRPAGMSDRPEITRAAEDGTAKPSFPARISMSTAGRRTIHLSSPHATKFRLATGLLLGIGIAALALAVALGSRPASDGQSHPWSTWKPTAGGNQGAAEIAEHVAPTYRLTPATQLSVVTLVNLANPNMASGGTTTSGLTVAVNTAAPGAAQSLSLLGGSAMAYNLCGTGSTDCRLPGTPSAGRLLLLRREALELALYTFRYIDGVTNVVCILPPSYPLVYSPLMTHLPPAKPSSNVQPVGVAVVFQRQELQPWLQQPLSRTLSAYPPPIPELPMWEKTTEADLVDQITAHGLFSEQIESQQTGGHLLVLNQLAPQ